MKCPVLMLTQIVPDAKDQDWHEREEKNTYAGIFFFFKRFIFK